MIKEIKNEDTNTKKWPRFVLTYNNVEKAKQNSSTPTPTNNFEIGSRLTAQAIPTNAIEIKSKLENDKQILIGRFCLFNATKSIKVCLCTLAGC